MLGIENDLRTTLFSSFHCDFVFHPQRLGRSDLISGLTALLDFPQWEEKIVNNVVEKKSKNQQFAPQREKYKYCIFLT